MRRVYCECDVGITVCGVIYKPTCLTCRRRVQGCVKPYEDIDEWMSLRASIDKDRVGVSVRVDSWKGDEGIR